MKRSLRLLLLSLLPIGVPAQGQPAPLTNTQLRDPAKEAEAKTLMQTIRCVECQGQSVADSDAQIAGNMRALIRERIDRGESPAQVRAWLIERYGDYITYDPPLKMATWPLWGAPFALLAAGFLIARMNFRRRK